ncbi:hypothetical protein [Paenimyroides ummariense]|nr:hypothetical protein [Paenimyroides ummariense]
MEKLLKIIMLAFLCSIYNACKPTNAKQFYNKISNFDANNKNDRYSEWLHFGKKEILNTDKYVLKFLKDSLKNTNHIYYVYSSIDSGPSRVIIFDVDNQKKYVVTNNLYKNKNFSFRKYLFIDEADIEEFYYDFVLNKAISNRCDELLEINKSQADANFSSGGVQAVYEINLEKNEISRCVFGSILISKYYMEAKYPNKIR